MPKFSNSAPHSERDQSDTSDFIQVVRASRIAYVASILSILPACAPNSVPLKSPVQPVVMIAAPEDKPTAPLTPISEHPVVEQEAQHKDEAVIVREVSENEEHSQIIDEQMGSAQSAQSAISGFYRDPLNAKLYFFSSLFATDMSQPLYLGLLEGRPGYRSNLFLQRSSKLKTLEQMRAYCHSHFAADPDIQSAIDSMILKNGGSTKKTP